MVLDITAIIVAFVSGILGPVILLWLRKKLTAPKKVDALHETINFSNLIDDQLTELRNTLKADRVWIAQFHNGSRFYPTGKSIQKYSIFYEVNDIGISRISPSFQNIPVSLFTRAFDELYEKGEYCVNDFDDIEENAYGLRDAAKSTGCRSVFVVALRINDEKITGFMGIEAVKKPRKFKEDERHVVRETAAFVSGLLAKHSKTK